MREPISTNKIRKIQQRLLGVVWFSARAFLIFVLAGLAFIGFSSSIPDAFAVSAAGQNGKKPPPPPPPTNFPGPSNLRITGLTSSTVALAWDPSPDSRSFIYVVRFSGGLNQYLPKTQTSTIWTDRLTLGQTYSFLVYAVDSAANQSNNSNTVTVTLPSTPTPFTAPAVNVTDIGVRHISLAWLATGGTPYIRYLVYKDGVLLTQQPTDKLADTFYLLAPATTYTFTIQARDKSNNLSPPSNIAVTTKPSNPNDVTPPTMPANLTAFHYEGDREMSLSWTQSVDDFDAQSVIRYDVYVNGVLEDILIGRSYLQTVYGVFGTNTVTVIAIDTAGNQSTAATITVII
jgi:Fibronectin type III domain